MEQVGAFCRTEKVVDCGCEVVFVGRDGGVGVFEVDLAEGCGWGVALQEGWWYCSHCGLCCVCCGVVVMPGCRVYTELLTSDVES